MAFGGRNGMGERDLVMVKFSPPIPNRLEKQARLVLIR